MTHIIKSNPHTKEHPTERNKFWCKNCKTWVHINYMDTKRLDDDVTVEKRCRVCGLLLIDWVLNAPPQ